jgi:hypothetical protein
MPLSLYNWPTVLSLVADRCIQLDSGHDTATSITFLQQTVLTSDDCDIMDLLKKKIDLQFENVTDLHLVQPVSEMVQATHPPKH